MSVHIGSQITDHKPYAKMLKVIGSVIKKSNHNFDFVDLGGEIACRDAGKLRREGKEYIVKDGDVMHFLFNT